MNTVRKHFTIRHRCIIIKRFVKNFLQDILMKCFAVSFIWQFSSGLRRFCPANPTNAISDWRRAFSVWKREKKDKKAFVRFVCYTHDADRWKSIKMNTIYSSTVIRPISFVSFLSLLLGFSIVIDIKNRKADRIKFTNAARSLSGITHEKCIHRKEAYNKIKKDGTRGSGNVAEPLWPMASKISKKFCAVRFRLRSAAALATSAEREVPRANGRAAAGSAADFYGNAYFLRNIDSHA